LIRFSGFKPDGTRIIGIGITPGMFAKLMQGETSHIALDALGLPNTEIILIAGKSEMDLTRDFGPLMDEKTNMRVDPAFIKKG